MAFSLVLPLLFQEPAVPMMVPESFVSAMAEGIEERNSNVRRRRVALGKKIGNSKFKIRSKPEDRISNSEIILLQLRGEFGSRERDEASASMEHIMVFGLESNM